MRQPHCAAAAHRALGGARWNDGQQIGDADVHAALEQERGDLAPMVRLVIEEVLDQWAEGSGEADAGQVAVVERGGQMLGAEFSRPLFDQGIQVLANAAQLGQVGCQRR